MADDVFVHVVGDDERQFGAAGGKRLLEHGRVKQAERVIDGNPDEAVRVTMNLAGVNGDPQPDPGGLPGQPVVTAQQCPQVAEQRMDHGNAGPPGRDDHQDAVAAVLVQALLPADGRSAEGADEQPVERVPHGELHLIVAGGEAGDVDHEDDAVPRIAECRPSRLEPNRAGDDGTGEQHGKHRDGYS
jgi:hypothetical protein